MVKHEKLSLVGLEINKSLWFNFWWSRKLAGGLRPHKVGFFRISDKIEVATVAIDAATTLEIKYDRLAIPIKSAWER